MIDPNQYSPRDYTAKDFVVSLDFDGMLAQGLELKVKYAKEWFDVGLMPSQAKSRMFNHLMSATGRTDINYRSLMDRINSDHIMEYSIPQGCELLRPGTARETVSSLRCLSR